MDQPRPHPAAKQPAPAHHTHPGTHSTTPDAAIKSSPPSVHSYRGDAPTATAAPPPGTVIQAKHFSTLALIGLCYCILNSWTAASASLSVALPSGGPVAILWGLVVATCGTMAIALSMAEICSHYPTTGGQYHWVYLLSPPAYRNGLAYTAGWLSVAGWVALTATASSLAAQLITGLIALLHPNYESQPWHVFLLYVAFALGAWLVNAFAVRILDAVNRVAMFWSLVGALVIVITTLACAVPDGRVQSARFVFGGFNNSTGWNDGVAWILGLLQAAFSLIGADGATHLIDEISHPARNAPLAMVLAVAIGSSSTFVVLTVLLFVIRDFDAVVSSPNGALGEILYQAVANRAGAVCLLIFPICSMAFTATALLTTSSRMVQAFARDRGLPFCYGPLHLERVDARLEVPLQAMTLTTAWVVVFGCIYLGSDSALNAILSSSVVLLQASYCLPILLVLIRGRKATLLGPSTSAGDDSAVNAGQRRTLGPILGPALNATAVAYIAFTDVFFLFPPELPVTGSNMNYTVVVVAIVVVLAATAWLVEGKSSYVGPVDVEAVLRRCRGEAHVGAGKGGVDGLEATGGQ
ncbi:uncharacterized protein PFL1_02419 [Pseudozyma flocculosa PF-1]|uniref:Related to Choline permease n=1 Tax=Pseudozyma flocculosa TaxID=84751 RepID=A0A5C3F7Q6_9BASI|nr:uncharacterized protein PFL1_02419 [Pseudozyma flocculosa PF-1]EPQ30303.1 hypothetical protein PFL1_02419 [Pseudozyma flocculosa PF-1]SPO39755.1 related to Choline permease [Pseudozyma flocculosa]